jgi:large subunit ribosomal protein L3
VISSIIGKKVGMTSLFDAKGQTIPVTVIEAGPLTVTQVKTREKDGYCAVQVAFGEKKQQRATKPELGLFKKANTGPKQVLREVQVKEDEVAAFTAGQTIGLAELGFNPGDFVDVIGTSIGKGFAGVVKRHKFHLGPESHGAHEYKRHGGSIGTNTTPGRVHKGLRMPGHMGAVRVTVQNLKVVEVKAEDNLILVHGAIPGHTNAIVTVRASKKKAAKAAGKAAKKKSA